MFKRLVSFLMVISLLFSTGFVDAVAIAVQDQEDQPEQVTVQVGDVSDMFVVEETEPEPTETEDTEATETTVPAETTPVIITAETTDFTYTVLESGGCSITAYTGAATAELVIPGELDGYVVEAIGSNAFYKVTTLQSVTLPDSVLSIGRQAFYGCTALTDIRLSANLTEIGYGAFMKCTGLTQLALPATVKTIGGQAFVDCTSLSSVTYPAGLEDVSSMGDGIFVGCTALTSMEIPEGVTALPAYIFQDAASLQSVTLPSTLETIGNYAFEGSGITSMVLPAGLTAIGSYAFMNCKNLAEIQLGESLTAIGYSAFMKCTGLTQLELPDTVKSIGGQAFVDCTNLASVTYPAGLEDVSSIGEGIFVGCTALTSMEIPEGVTALPAYIFQDAASLQSVTLPSTLETIGAYAFEGSGIVEMTLPASVTSIGSQAFANCTALTDIQLSESLTEIGYSAFMKCTGLTQLELPDTVKSIGGQAFVDCANLSSVTYPAGLEEVSNIGEGIFVGCTALTSMEIPEGVTALPDYVFQDAISLQSVSLPSTLKTIGAYAFEGSGIVEMTLPASVTSIGGHAFANCAALTNIRLSESLTEIGYSAFMKCTGLTQLELPDTVKSIGGQAFANCDNLASVTYPASLENVSNIGDGIFKGCTALTYIEIPEGVTVLPDYVFQDAANLLAVTLPSTLERIGNHAFSGTGIVAITLPAGVTSIGSYAFMNCANLAELQLSESLTTIGYQAFMRCTSLTSIQMPQTLTSLGSGAFRDCTALESVVLSDGIKELERESFSGCSSLTAVHLPRNLKYIRAKAFENCAGLTELYIPDSVTSIADNAFTGIPALTLRCSLGSAAAEFALDHRVPMIPTQISGDTAASELDTEKSYYIHNYDGLSAAGVMSMSVHYEMKADATVAPTAITIHIYDFAALQENTLTLDGQLCTNYEYDEATGRLTVPVTATSGTLRFCMKPLRYEALTSYARLICTDRSGNESIELIGAVHSLMPVLNISAPAETAANTVYITGLAIPEAEVSVFLDGVFQKKVMANKVGDYSATVSLGDPEDGKEYIITVEAVDRNGSPAVAQANVRYRYNAPVLTGFVMRYNHKTVDLMNLQGTRPVMVFRSDATFHFEVSFENPESVSSVYVVSTRNNVKKYIKAYWSQEKEMFVAEGYFDPLDHGYVPGTITLEYVRGGEKVSFDREIDYASPEAIDALPQLWKDADIDIITNTETEVALDITAGYGENQVSFELSITRSEIPSYLTPATAESYGYTKMTDDYGRDMYVRSHGGGGRSLVPQFSVIDFLGDEVSDYCIDQIKDAFGEAFEAAGKSGNVFWSALGIAFTLQDGIGTYKDIKELQKVAANNPALTAEEKQMFNEQAMHMQHLNGFSTVVQLALGAASIYALIAFPPAVPIIAVGAAAVGVIFDLTMKLKMWELTAMAYGINGKFKWAIDPSGYVYDTVTGLRLGGVTVHAYWIENVDEDPNFFNNKPAEDEYGVLWASMEYSQMNPLLTDENGCYAWDVPEGWWRVSYEKEGYESTWSEWLPVPPPQTDVNIGLTPLVVNHLPGDIDGDRAVTQEDVVYLLLYTTFGGENYPLNFASGDIDGNETVNENDVVYLLLHTLYGEATYPLIAQ